MSVFFPCQCINPFTGSINDSLLVDVILLVDNVKDECGRKEPKNPPESEICLRLRTSWYILFDTFGIFKCHPSNVKWIYLGYFWMTREMLKVGQGNRLDFFPEKMAPTFSYHKCLVYPLFSIFNFLIMAVPCQTMVTMTLVESLLRMLCVY